MSSQPIDNQRERSELEMDKMLEEYGLLEDGMTAMEKRDLIQTLEVSKISAQTEENFRLTGGPERKEEDEISVLPSSPFLQRKASSVAGTSASCPSPADQPSPLIGGAQLAQRRRPLRVPPSLSQDSEETDSRQQPSRSADGDQQPSRSADSPDRACGPADGPEGGSLQTDSVTRRRPVVCDSSSEDGASLAEDIPPESAAASGAEPAASPTPPTLHYVNQEGRRESVERSERTVQLLELLSDAQSPEDNVRRVLKHLELEQERALAAAEDTQWQDDILPTRGFQKSSLPPPPDAARLEYRPQTAAGQRRRSTAPEPSPAPSPASSPEPAVVPREPAESGGLQTADAGRQHSRANQLLQRAIGANWAKKPAAAAKLSLKLSSRSRASAAAAASDAELEPEQDRQPQAARRPGVSDGCRSNGAAPALPLLPTLASGEGRGAAATSTARRRPASSPPVGPESSAKQARRRPSASEEIRPGPLRLQRRPRPEKSGRAMVPLVTQVQTPGSSSKRRTPAGLSTTISSSSSEDDSAAAAAAAAASRRTLTSVRPGPSTAGAGGPRRAGDPSGDGAPSGSGTGAPSCAGMSSGAGAPSGAKALAPTGARAGAPPGARAGAGAPSGARAGVAPSGASAAPGAAGDTAIEQQIQCPLCTAFFPKDKIEAHASRCEGEDVLEIEESPSPPVRRCINTASRATRERTPRGQQRCRMCSELYEEGAAYLEHVDECVRHRRPMAGGEQDPAPHNDRWLTSNGHRPVSDDRSRPTGTAGSTADSDRCSPTFQRISAQTGSCIDYNNQFPVASGSGTGRKRAARGRRKRGRGTARKRSRGRGRRS